MQQLRLNRCQRCHAPPGEPLEPRRFDVAEILDDKTAEAFVVANHYAASYPSARKRYGLFLTGELVGTIVFSTPMHDNVLAALKLPRAEAAELGRLVLVGSGSIHNNASYFVARAFAMVSRDHGIRGIISDADPMRTHALDGRVVCRGHAGYVYQASNGVYLGQTPRRTRYLLPSGHVFVQRNMSKVRGREVGWEDAAEQLVRFGAAPLSHRAEAEERLAWLHRWVPALTRRVRHPGNHRYAFGLDRLTKKNLPAGKRYPKLDIQAALFAGAA